MCVSLSTAWNYRPDGSVKEMLTGIKDVGFEAIELGYKITNEHLAEIIPLIGELGLSVSSIHNFCPLPYDGPSPRHPSNYYRLSALDDEERKKAVDWTRRSIDTAVIVGAKVVVVHAGTVEMENDLASTVLKMCKMGKKNIEEFHATVDEFVNKRRKARAPFIDSIVKSFKDIMPYAQEKGVLIGLETRYYPDEIPNYEEIGEFLDIFHKQGMYYWHDFGHAEVNSRLEIAPHRKVLESYQDRLIGFHIHGVKEIKDHFAPFTGDFDLEALLGFIKDNHIKVIESHHEATAQELKNAVNRLRGK